MQKKKLIYTLITLLALVVFVLTGCQVDSINKEVAIAGDDSLYNSLMENPAFKEAIEGVNAKIKTGELKPGTLDLSRAVGDFGIRITPEGPVVILPGQTVTLTATAASGGIIYFWQLYKDGATTPYTAITYVNTTQVIISEAAYGTGNYTFCCSAYDGKNIWPLNSNVVSVTCATWHTFTPTYSGTVNGTGAWYSYNTICLPNSGNGIITYYMTGGYKYRVNYSISSNGGSGSYSNGNYVTGGYSATPCSGTEWTGGNFEFNAAGTAGYQATLYNLVFERAY